MERLILVLGLCVLACNMLHGENDYLFGPEPAALKKSDVTLTVSEDLGEGSFPAGDVRALSLLPGLKKLGVSAGRLKNTRAVASNHWRMAEPPTALEVIDTVCALPSLQSLELYDVRNIGKPEWKDIGKLTGLTELSVYPVDPAIFELQNPFGSLTKVQKLKIGPIDNDSCLNAMKDIIALRNLQALHLVDCELSAASLVYMARLPKLDELSLDSCYITDEGLEVIGEFKKLKLVSLRRSRGFSSSGVEALCRCGTITGLDLKTCDVEFPHETAQVKRAGGLRNLESLRVSGKWNSPPFPRKDPLLPHWQGPRFLCQILTTLPHFRHLWFEDVPGDLYDEDLSWAALGQLTDLESLSLENCGALGPHACQAIKKLSNLKSLNLTGCVVSKPLVSAVKSLPKLKELAFSLAADTESPRILGLLPGMTTLETLRIAGYSAKVKPVVYLSEILAPPQLKRIFLLGLQLEGALTSLKPKVTAAEVVSIRFSKGFSVKDGERLAAQTSVRSIDLTGTLSGDEARAVRDSREPLISVLWE